MSILNVDKVQPIGGGSTITVDATDIQATSATITASKFVGSGDLSITGVSTFTDNIHIGTRTHTANSSTALKNIHMGAEFWNGTEGDYRALKFIAYQNGTTNSYGLGVSNSTLELQSNNHISFFAGGVSGNVKTRRFHITSGGDYLFDSGILYVQDKIGHYNDANTNIRFPTNDTISMETGGGERLRINSGGQVNIGGDYTQTTYPFSVLGSTGGNNQINIVQRLKYSGDSNQYNNGVVIAFTNTNTNANAYSYIGARIDSGSSGANANALVFATNATNTAPTEKLRITSAGRVGINETSPDVDLHIKNTNPAIYLEGTNGSGRQHKIWSAGTNSESLQFTSGNLLYNADVHYFRATNESTEYARIDSSGRFGIGTNNPTKALHVSASQPEIFLEHTGGYDMTLTTNDGMGQNGITVNGGFLSLAYNNKNIVMCRTGGNVGINSTAPKEKLDVSGSINAGGENSPVFQIRNDPGTYIRAFKHYFDAAKGDVSGNTSNRTIVNITIDESFHQAGFEVTYFTRLQAVSDQHVRPNKIIFGVNRFNSASSVNVTKTVVEQHSDAASHCDVNVVSVSGTNYRIQLEFSTQPNVSSAAGGWIEGATVLNASFADVDYYYGART